MSWRPFGKYFSVRTVPVLKDNFTYLVRCSATQHVGVVDVSKVAPVVAALAEVGVAPGAPAAGAPAPISILTTHKHWDHSGGNAELKAAFPGTAVYGGRIDKVPECTHPLDDGAAFQLGELAVAVLHTPCHTSGHVLFHVFHPDDAANGAVFVGDTFFVAGLGAFFEGNAKQFVAAAEKFSALPPPTAMYPGHEYTMNFMKYAAEVEPANARIQERAAHFAAELAAGRPSVPSTVGDEAEINVFVKAAVSEAFRAQLGVAVPAAAVQKLYDACP
jgi:hydroxyacylglutathione hydrolase